MNFEFWDTTDETIFQAFGSPFGFTAAGYDNVGFIIKLRDRGEWCCTVAQMSWIKSKKYTVDSPYLCSQISTQHGRHTSSSTHFSVRVPKQLQHLVKLVSQQSRKEKQIQQIQAEKISFTTYSPHQIQTLAPHFQTMRSKQKLSRS